MNIQKRQITIILVTTIMCMVASLVLVFAVHSPVSAASGVGDLSAAKYFNISSGVLNGLSNEGIQYINQYSTVKITVPEGVVTIPLGTSNETVFYEYRKKITSIVLPSSLQTLGGYAFYEHENLTSVDLSKTKITTIGERAFRSCTSLTSVKLPNTLTKIDTAAFRECTNLTNIEIPASVNYIDSSVFYNAGLVSIDLSKTAVKSLFTTTFGDCTRLAQVKLPAGLTGLYNNVFLNCASLTSIELPATLTTIEAVSYQPTFGGCTNLTAIIAANAAHCNTIKALPESKTNLGDFIKYLTYPISLQMNLTDANGQKSTQTEKMLVGSGFSAWHYVNGQWVKNADYVPTLPTLPRGYVWQYNGQKLTATELKSLLASTQSAGNATTINVVAVETDDGNTETPEPETPENPETPTPEPETPEPETPETEKPENSATTGSFLTDEILFFVVVAVLVVIFLGLVVVIIKEIITRR